MKKRIQYYQKFHQTSTNMLYATKDITKLKEIIDGVLEILQYSFKIVTKFQLRTYYTLFQWLV